MDWTTKAALLGVAATMLIGILTIINDQAKQRAEFKAQRQERSTERETVRLAMRAEVTRVLEVVEQQLKWIETQSDDPMNWLPIHTPVWDAVAPRVGALDPQHVGQVARFFGYVAWSNDVLRLGDPRDDERPYKALADFTKAYRTALEAVKKEAPFR
jgi:hypothetical protein